MDSVVMLVQLSSEVLSALIISMMKFRGGNKLVGITIMNKYGI